MAFPEPVAFAWFSRASLELGLRGDVEDEGSGRVPRTLEVRREANSLAKGGEASRKTSMVVGAPASFFLSKKRQNSKGFVVMVGSACVTEM